MSQSGSVDNTYRVFDRKFVNAAIAIGVGYAVVIVIISSLFGRDAAGAAGVALTALATGIFKQSETLRFTRSSDQQTTIEVPKLRLDYLFLVSLSFMGAEALSALLAGIIISTLGLVSVDTGTDVQSFYSGLFGNPLFLASIIIAKCLAMIICGGLVGSTSARLSGLTFTYVFMGAFLAFVFSQLQMVSVILKSPDPMAFTMQVVRQPVYAFNLLWVSLPLIGAYLWLRFSRNRGSAGSAQ
jgi:hypothetical protein